MNTFDNIEQGDLVIKRGKHSAEIRIVEWVDGYDESASVLLVNGVEDLSYEGVDGIREFNKEWRLLAKARDLIEEE